MAVVEKELARNKLAANIMVDCSHANSNKDHNLQPLVMLDCAHQILEGNQSIVGVMIESNINAGNQAIPADLTQLKYGVSVTDACIDWPTTDKLLRDTRAKLKDVLPKRVPKTAGIRKIG
jgi:3-deoxy-7-phosphoheptulonate synthase